MAFRHINSPGQIGKLEIRNRISLPPMEKNWGDRLGNPTQRYIDYLAHRAALGVGVMNIEATFVDARGRGNLFQLGLWHDDNIRAHRRMNRAIQSHGCRISAELNHGGRNCNTHRTGLQPVGPSNVPSAIVGSHQLAVLSKEDIAQVVESFRQGARRAAEAGYDMITIHGAHGYLITSFLSEVYNQRDDEYGGSRVNRRRFLVEIYEAIREEVGKDMPVGLRVSAEEDVEGGYDIRTTIEHVQQLTALGLDFVDVSTGLYESLETLIQPMDMQPGCLLGHARRFKETVSIPVFSAGRINDMELAESAISSGECDFVHMGRAFHADPAILEKSLAGRKEDIVRCIACNKCCQQLFINLPSVCTVNADAGNERFSALKPAAEARRVMVVGGGMAGMEVAIVAANRGHRVTLFEKSDRLGGYVNVLQASRNHASWAHASADREHMLRQAGVHVAMGKEITVKDILAERPEVLVLATGTRPFMPTYVPGIDSRIVTDYESIVRGRTDIGRNCIVVGGQTLGTTVAEHMAEAGAKVTIIEATDSIASDLEFMAQKMLLNRIASRNNIDVRLNANVEDIGPDNVVVQSGGTRETLGNVDQVVFALERDMNRDLIEEVSAKATGEFGVELHLVGDCVWPGDTYDAVREGNLLGRRI